MQSLCDLVRRGGWSVRLALLAALAFSCGCSGGSGEDTPEVHPVSGTVTYKGSPVAGAIVTFLGDGTGRPAVGTTDASGKFQLSTFGQNDGAVAGSHKVTVVKTNAPPPNTESVSMEEAARREAPPAAEVTSEIPAKYADVTQSGLSFTVTADGPNNFEISLTD